VSELDILALQQHLYLAASHVEATAARWLHEAGKGHRQCEDHALIHSMRELLEASQRQRDQLAAEINATRARAPELGTQG